LDQELKLLPNMKTALITGVSGYLGSHLAKRLNLSGWNVIGLDIKFTFNHYLNKFYPFNILDRDSLFYIFNQHKIDVVFHLAGKIEVGESVDHPTEYFNTNVAGTCILLDAMKQSNVKNIVYSSTAGLYKSKSTKLSEEDIVNPFNNPYAGSKYAAELAIRQSGFNFAIFRYFNLSGADSEGEFGECHEPETHLIPRILQNINNFTVYGDIFNTPDGTCVRDYVHVEDVAFAHVSGAEFILRNKESITLNLGTGEGKSVRQIMNLIEQSLNLKITYKVVEPRVGDPDCLVADISLAQKILTFKPKHDIMSIIKTAYNWEKNDRRKE
jgi:UDP-glucose 4-epimerase